MDCEESSTVIPEVVAAASLIATATAMPFPVLCVAVVVEALAIGPWESSLQATLLEADDAQDSSASAANVVAVASTKTNRTNMNFT